MLRFAVLVALASAACTSRGAVMMSQSDLKVRGTRAFNAQFEQVYDAAYLSLAKHEGRIAQASRLEGVIENERVELTAPAGWQGTAYRSYAVSVYQDGAQVAVTAVPRLWANEKDVSDEAVWVLPGRDGEEEHWERLLDGVDSLLETWREVPELSLERSRAELSVLGYKVNAPADWRGVELAVDRRSAVAQAQVRGSSGCADCPGGLNPSIVFSIERRQPPADATKLETTALESALGPKLTTPEAWDVTETPTGRRGTGLVVAGDAGKTVSVVWHVWDAGDPAWMFRIAAGCGPAEGPANCDLAWEAMINGVITPLR